MDIRIGNGTENAIVDSDQVMNNIKKGVYGLIGLGSGRMVFDLANGYVLKVARNKAGTAQNEAEYRISTNDCSDLFAYVLDATADFEFLVMERANKVNNIWFVWDYFNVRNNLQLYRVERLKNAFDKHDLVLVDLGRTSSWGNIEGEPVIIDYGLTRQVRRKYYFFL